MALVDRAVGAQKIEVLLALHIPNMDAFTAVQHHWERVVIVGPVGVLHGHQLGRTVLRVCVHKGKNRRGRVCFVAKLYGKGGRKPYFCPRKRQIYKSTAMSTQRTFTMIKPDATGAGHTGKIIDRIIEAGFTIKAMKWTRLSLEDAQAFYGVHAERPFFGELTEYMSSAPIVAAILEKDNAVADFRTLIGATNPAEAAPGTIRADFAESIAANAVHGSDSDENAAIEGSFFFSQRELA